MKGQVVWSTLPRRVYYTAALLALTIVAVPRPAPAQVQLTLSPMMLRGSAQAPLLIVEFSDYQ